MNWIFILPLIINGLLIIPSLIISEMIYNISRNEHYNDMEGYQSIVLETSEGTSLQGWYTNISDKAVLIVHGHADNSKIMLDRYVPVFEQLGYDIVLLDLRNHGRSEEDKPIMLGSKESKDVETYLRWMEDQSWNNYVLFGTSMGAIASLLSTKINTSKLSNIILDSMYIDPKSVMNNNFKKHYIIQPWRFIIVTYLANIRHSIDEFPDIRSKLSSVKIDTLIVHGSEDEEANVSVIDEIKQLENPKITTAIIENGNHSRLYEFKELTTIVRTFLGG